MGFVVNFFLLFPVLFIAVWLINEHDDIEPFSGFG